MRVEIWRRILMLLVYCLEKSVDIVRKHLLPLGTLILSVLLSLLAAEVVIRAARPQPRLVITPGGFYTTDPPGRYRLSPGYRGRIYNRAEYDNEIRINTEGLRGEESGQQREGLTRLLSIGDSFVFGVGVEDFETFTAVIADRLVEQGIPAEGLNAGIPAFGVPDAVSWLSRHGIDLRPDVVILSIFQGNDLVDASPDREEILIVDGLLVPGKSAGGIKAWLYRHSHLYVLVKGLFEQPLLLPLRAKLGLGEPWKVRVLREEFGVYRNEATTELRPAIQATDQALGDLVSLAAERGFAVIAILIPSEIQVDPERWRSGLASLDLSSEEYDPQVPTQIFTDLLNRHSIPTLDLGPVFARGLAAGEDLYFRLDRHWTKQGHELAADAIGSFLTPRLNAKDPSDMARVAESEESRD